ncbi:ABC transporter substrate-binding protein [Paenibacillus senegalimassiliensis]|uniref:ABC transporter substrate-binding protein n=1 Tax=Paenibacillus senegalimassiliensis TaxID=1737426 RepID=UPI00073E1A2D|nr:ABC transporter substrate-binding protein [Paenibacillus senegalimassiliensis]
MKRNAKYALALALLLGLTLIVGACGSKDANTPATGNEASSAGNNTGEQNADQNTAEPEATEREVTDGLGNKVTVPANPQRVIASYLEDHLVALGVTPVAQWSIGDGTSLQGYLQGSLKDVPPIPFDLPFEAVMSFDPDLIILDSAEMASGDKYEQYSKIAPTYVVGTEQNNDWRKELLAIGDVLNKSEEAQKALDEYEAKATQAKESIQQELGEISAAVIWILEKNNFIVSENLSSGDVIYHDLGMKVPAQVHEISEGAEANWNPIATEVLAELDADYLFIINDTAVTKEQMQADPIWSGIPAVKNGHVYEYPRDSSWFYTGVLANSQIIDDVLGSIISQ